MALACGRYTLPDATLRELLGLDPSSKEKPKSTESYDVVEQLPVPEKTNSWSKPIQYLVRQKASPATEYLVELFDETSVSEPRFRAEACFHLSSSWLSRQACRPSRMLQPFARRSDYSLRTRTTHHVAVKEWPGRLAFEAALEEMKKAEKERIEKARSDSQAVDKRRREHRRQAFEAVAERPEIVDLMVKYHKPYSGRSEEYLCFYSVDAEADPQLTERASDFVKRLDRRHLGSPKFRKLPLAHGEWQRYCQLGLLDELENALGLRNDNGVKTLELLEAFGTGCGTEDWWIDYSLTAWILSASHGSIANGSGDKATIENGSGDEATAHDAANVIVSTLDGSVTQVALPKVEPTTVGMAKMQFASCRGLAPSSIKLSRQGETQLLRDDDKVVGGDSLLAIINPMKFVVMKLSRSEDHS